MQVYPTMDIRFPENREAELIAVMRSRAASPWRWQDPAALPDPLGWEGYQFFHRDEVLPDPPCLLCLYKKAAGTLVVINVVPDPNAVLRLSVEQYVRILGEFDTLIAEPAAEVVGGMTAIETHNRTLEDYFSVEAIRLLERFCLTSNAKSLGSHPSDQEKWLNFLICVHRTNADVSGDVFGSCLEAKHWWPEHDIPRLVDEYDFAIQLLHQYDGRNEE
jgi:hypothetical protein